MHRLCGIEGCPVDTIDRLEVLALLQGILVRIRRLNGARIPGERERTSLERWGALNALLGACPDRHPTLDEAAASAGMSRWGFCRYFKWETGLTWTEWLRHRSLDRAKDLLAGTFLSISRIAMDAGFANLSWFNRSFLSVCGCTPGEYRRRSGRIGAGCYPEQTAT